MWNVCFGWVISVYNALHHPTCLASKLESYLKWFVATMLLVVPNASSIRKLLNSFKLNYFKLNYAETIGVPTATPLLWVYFFICELLRPGEIRPTEPEAAEAADEKMQVDSEGVWRNVPAIEGNAGSLDSHESVWNHVSLDFFKGYLMGSILSFRRAAKDVVQIASAVPFLSAAAVHLATAPIRSRCAVRETKGATLW